MKKTIVAFGILNGLAFSKSLKNQVYINLFTGRLPGIRSVTLRPELNLGYKLHWGIKRFDVDFKADGYYGSADTGSGTQRNKLLQLNLKAVGLYNFYQDKHSKIGIGLFAKDYEPLTSFKPSITPSQVIQYGAEETEIPTNDNYNFGSRLRAKYDYKKIGTRNKLFLIGDIDKPKLALNLDMRFYFERKYDNKIFTSHDGLAGTKREFDLTVGTMYYLTKNLDFHVDTYGFNNLNRGNSSTLPSGFKDGVYAGFGYRF
ncbi:MAG: hypothetical protein RXN80_01465 [Hydrogenobaculum sp.]